MQFFQDWGNFLAAFVVFFLSHSIPVRPPVKSRIVAKIGARGFALGYSALSIAILTWIIVAAGRAPYIELWSYQPWQNYAPLYGMLAAIVIISMAFGQPNPLSFGGWNNDRFDPENPGIIGWVRHPLLIALFIWSAAHMVPNGNLAHVIVFGLFGGFALLGRKIIDKRSKRLLGLEKWQHLSNTKRQIRITARGLKRIGIGVLIYLAVLYSHEIVIGVTPFIWD
ncbi:MAG TPA: NnrU family protein [Rhodobacteraceae bacterium]|nr:NnrU family protein [Paracoccaceae bacterium]